jgi:prepilin-type N-terminal cleavage/methylation domain-containing protein
MPPAAAKRGFTLIELAVAIAVIALLIGSFLAPLRTRIELRNYDETQRVLNHARETLIGYAAANGRFPCPASTASIGVESFAGGGDAINGNCSNFFDGILPAASLGFTPTNNQGYAVDAWGLTQNRIRYAVSNWNSNALTKTGGMAAAGMASIASASLLHVCDSGVGTTGSDCGTAGELTSKAPVVIWSLGPNAPTGGASPHEDKNLDNNRVFVMRPPSNVAGAEFDDVVTWIASSSLFYRMVAAGKLP